MKLRPDRLRFLESVRRNPKLLTDLPSQEMKNAVTDAFGKGTKLADDVVSELPASVQSLLPLGRTGALVGGTVGGAATGAALDVAEGAIHGELPSANDLKLDAIAGSLGPVGGAILSKGSRFFARMLTQLRTPRTQKGVMAAIQKEREAQDRFEDTSGAARNAV